MLSPIHPYVYLSTHVASPRKPEASTVKGMCAYLRPPPTETVAM